MRPNTHAVLAQVYARAEESLPEVFVAVELLHLRPLAVAQPDLLASEVPQHILLVFAPLRLDVHPLLQEVRDLTGLLHDAVPAQLLAGCDELVEVLQHPVELLPVLRVQGGHRILSQAPHGGIDAALPEFLPVGQLTLHPHQIPQLLHILPQLRVLPLQRRSHLLRPGIPVGIPDIRFGGIEPLRQRDHIAGIIVGDRGSRLDTFCIEYHDLIVLGVVDNDNGIIPQLLEMSGELSCL